MARAIKCDWNEAKEKTSDEFGVNERHCQILNNNNNNN